MANILKSFLTNRYAVNRFPQDRRKALEGYPKVSLVTFGECNRDKYFYVIWCNNEKSGLFSILSHVLCHIKIALSCGMIPVVDLKNYKTVYNEFELVNGTDNAWEYYFNPVSKFTLDEVYKSSNVFICDGRYPPGMSYNITTIEGLYSDVFMKCISCQGQVSDKISEHEKTVDDKTLGVHFRGQEMKIAPGHPFPPTINQMLKYTDTILEKRDIERIFLVTEESKYLDVFKKRYGSILNYSNSFRTYGKNAYNITPRKNHRYNLGLEVLADAFLLAKCGGILCGGSNVSEFARFVNNGKYIHEYLVYNGTNSRNPLFSRYLYFIKEKLPPNMYGLSDTLVSLK